MTVHAVDMDDTRVLIAEVAHESNSFVHDTTGRAAFQARRELFGEEVIEELRTTNSEIAGFLSVFEAAEYHVTPALSVTATPGGVVEQQTFERYWEHLAETIRNVGSDLDGVALVLHGAMVLEDHPDGDGRIISRVRELVGPAVPIVATLDLHTNITDRMLAGADALIAYEEYPHTDMYETGETAASILTTILEEGITTHHAIERPPLLSSGPTQNTNEPPMSDLMSLARGAEQRGEILKVNLTPGFFRSDVPEAGFAVSTVATSDRAGTEVARELATAVWERRIDFEPDYPGPEEAVAQANARANDDSMDGPIVLGDVGDNPGGGATGDETAVLSELLTQEVDNAGLVLMHDPGAVATCREAGVRSTTTLDLGGKKRDSHTDPIEGLACYVKTITDGRFTNTGPMGTGTANDTGSTVLLRCGNDVWVVVTDNRIQPLDAELWRHVGIQPERLDVIVVKSANHYRADYDRLAVEVVPVDSPGVNTMNPADYTYEHLDRPKFPLDDGIDYPPWN